ncbi:DUF2203 domain-containing protein [Pyrobaculum aerophilum]|uniref:DUF2203 domain-containing protein n=2 Tax=Pyrobaculum aerophilum TaxID=13773 RepID=Q8ZXK0_PYRAE|nr:MULTISPECIES: DUF2203 family protein [Pyrobaculum]AAL63347.1 conserved hypothetical protein [Pyrobaculum aerophilum str. IM2]MCX8136341.1 DUF2203 family protein [Pyrobaculum aerophilum]HII47713.1 DUF2203 family protein [Pyrobaculum aerophilum]
MRLFTLKEANEIIKELRPLLLPVVQTARRWDSLTPQEMEEMERQAEWLLKAAAEMGFIIRDFVNGIVDFPAVTKNGEFVYLCWKVDEPEVMFYHGPEGFRGRRRINPELFQ